MRDCVWRHSKHGAFSVRTLLVVGSDAAAASCSLRRASRSDTRFSSSSISWKGLVNTVAPAARPGQGRSLCAHMHACSAAGCDSHTGSGGLGQLPPSLAQRHDARNKKPPCRAVCPCHAWSAHQ